MTEVAPDVTVPQPTPNGKVRLNLGAGGTNIEGFIPIDRKTGGEVYPLDYPDNSVDEIYASHVLEHFPFTRTEAVLREWARVLKPGGRLSVAVPDFDYIIDKYREGKTDEPLEGYLFGGHVDNDDVHHAVFTTNKLMEQMESAGVVNIERFKSEYRDCSSLPVSLNLRGVKGESVAVKPGHVGGASICAVMSVPRVGFMDNFLSSFSSLVPLGIPLRKHTGVFWEQCIERAFEESVAEGFDAILAIDYDSFYTVNHVKTLVDTFNRHPEVDALAPLQTRRFGEAPLLTIEDEDGNRRSKINKTEFESDILKLSSAHFGLTLIRVSALKDLPRPWFWSKPGDNGSWTDDSKVDADASFWRAWKDAGKNVYLANRVAIGHLELTCQWPAKDWKVIHQHPNHAARSGPPEGVWK